MAQRVLTILAIPLLAWIGSELWKNVQRSQLRVEELRKDENRVLDDLSKELEGTITITHDLLAARSELGQGCSDEGGVDGHDTPTELKSKVADERCLRHYLDALRRMDLAVSRLAWQTDALPLMSRRSYENLKTLKWEYFKPCSDAAPTSKCGWRQRTVRAVYGYGQGDLSQERGTALRYCHGDRRKEKGCWVAADLLRREALDLGEAHANQFFCSTVLDLNELRLEAYRQRQRELGDDGKRGHVGVEHGYGRLIRMLEENISRSTCTSLISGLGTPAPNSGKP